MAADLLLAIDQGTTGTTVLVLDRQLNVLGRHSQEFPQIFPQPGWVEHDPAEIWKSVAHSVSGALVAGDIDPERIAGIGITNQRETSLLWERASGKALHNAIVWQCRRSTEICTELKAAGKEPVVRKKTGLVLDPYFSGTKVTWLFREFPEIAEQATSGEVAFGTIDSYLVWRLTDGAAHVTDVSNASRTLFLNLETLDWDDELLEIFGAPRAMLPEVRSCAEIYGHTRGLGFLPDGIPVSGMAGDQQAALFGQACFAEGEAKATYGTGSFILMNIGSELVHSQNGLLTTVAWKIDDTVTYALEGSAFIAGAAVQWLRDGLGIIKNSADVEELAAQVDDSGGVIFVPALAGLGAPHWRPEARGAITGITRGTTAANIARAVLEGVAFQNADIIKAMQEDSGSPLATLKVDGGAAANDLLMQFQADLLDTEIVRPAMLETTALGAAFLAGIGVGLYKNLDEVRQSWNEDRRFSAKISGDERSNLLHAWGNAVGKS